MECHERKPKKIFRSPHMDLGPTTRGNLRRRYELIESHDNRFAYNNRQKIFAKGMLTINNKGISLVQNSMYIFKQDQLSTFKNSHKDDKEYFHIYMVAKRPLIMFHTTSYDIEDGIFNGMIRIAFNDTFRNVRIQIPFEETITKVDFEMNDQYIIIETAKQQVTKVHAAFVLQTFLSQCDLDSPVLDLEVLYIGRSFGNKEMPTREVFDRLKHHETVQRIYSEKSWDSDIWLTAWRFTPNSIAFIDPTDTDDFLMKYIHDLVDSKKNNTRFLQISDKQNIAVAEAALINYFKPPYNKNFKHNFPSSEHEYKECYELDLDYVMVELDTAGLGFRLWSQAVEVNKEHIISYTFDSKQDFENLFNFCLHPSN